jgi:hypothetical protein
MESISQLWNLFHSYGQKKRRIRKMSYKFVIEGADLLYLEKDKLSDNMVKKVGNVFAFLFCL